MLLLVVLGGNYFYSGLPFSEWDLQVFNSFGINGEITIKVK